MDDRLENNNEQHHPVRKLLKKLPEVQASDDFEARLHRRIAEEKTLEKNGFSEKVFQPRRVPVFAYSLVALVAVGIVAYSVFLRTDGTPPTPIQEKSVSSSKESAKQYREEAENAPTPAVSSPSNTLSKTTDDVRKKAQSVDESKMKQLDGAGKGLKATEVQPMNADENKPLDQMQSAETPVTKVESEQALISPQSQRGDNQSVQQKIDIDKDERSSQQSGVNKTIHSLSTVPSVQGAAPSAQTHYFYNAYSATLADSLKRDSVQRAQRQLQLQQQKAKVKKPGN